jgi:hypothetical protein
VKETGPVTPRDFAEVVQRRGECPSGRLVSRESPYEATETALDGSPCQLGLVGEDLRNTMHPGVGHTHVGPQKGGRSQTSLEQGVEPGQRLGQRPFFPSRSRLWEMPVSRSYSLRPAATKGGRASSVSALRTALQ